MNQTQEHQYLNLIKDILKNGYRSKNRTGVTTISKFIPTPLKFDLTNYKMPLLTSKKMYWPGIVKELLWFLSGSTNTKILDNQNVKIWNANTSRSFLDKYGFSNYVEGDGGPLYSFQWRHFGAKYINCTTDYTDTGFDQIKYIIDGIKHSIKTGIMNRRLLLTAWNPSQLSQLPLPPCHVLSQFYLNRDQHNNYVLSSSLYQRSGDVGLGIPFNIASYSLLTHLIAYVTGIKAKEFNHIIGDAHIYENHIDGLKKQLKSPLNAFPTIHIKNNKKDIFKIKYNDIILKNYKTQCQIKLDMVI
jgi:thymidylate synthase